MSVRTAFRAKMARPAGQLTLAPLALDPLSAALAKRIGFEAVYLGGGGLGYQRAVTEALLTATEVADVCRQITERVDIAVVVDGGIGFGDAVHLHRTIRLVEDAGAAAIEIEDQVAPKRAHHHKGVEHLIAAEDMAAKIAVAVEARRDESFVIIARCNALSHEGIEGTRERLAAYEAAGADMIMCLPRDAAEAEAVSSATTTPLAAMTIGPGRPESEMLAEGYALSVDPMTAQVLSYRAIERSYQALLGAQDVALSRGDILATMREIGETMDISTLYAIEERTTEREHADREAR
jgi:2-methylisocitrate lyase-like PEP mutase family enzyme